MKRVSHADIMQKKHSVLNAKALEVNKKGVEEKLLMLKKASEYNLGEALTDEASLKVLKKSISMGGKEGKELLEQLMHQKSARRDIDTKGSDASNMSRIISGIEFSADGKGGGSSSDESVGGVDED